MLNPHMTVQGCIVDDSDTVNIYCWYKFTSSDNGKEDTHPIEIVIGGSARTVLRALKTAVKAREAIKHLSSQSETAKWRKLK